ncbi:MAG: hypothetical protein RR518_09410 [Coprobacillus sp.]
MNIVKVISIILIITNIAFILLRLDRKKWLELGLLECLIFIGMVVFCYIQYNPMITSAPLSAYLILNIYPIILSLIVFCILYLINYKLQNKYN